MALEPEDFELLGHISEGDFIAIEAKYHLKCLISLKIGTDHPVRRKRNIQVIEWTMKIWTSQWYLSSWLRTLKNV